MRITDLTQLYDDDFENELEKYDGFCEQRPGDAEEVLEVVDNLLKKFNLEVEIAETGDASKMSSTTFRIIKVKKGDRKR